MTAALKGSNGLPGPNGEKTEALAAWISNIKWFHSLENGELRQKAEERIAAVFTDFGLQGCQTRWLTLEEAGDLIQHYDITVSSMWEKLFAVPEQIRRAVDESKRTELLGFAMDVLPESVFHAAYDGAFSALQGSGDAAVKNAVSAALYVSGLAAAWELVGDKLGSNPFIPILELFELGYWPLGAFGSEFYILYRIETGISAGREDSA